MKKNLLTVAGIVACLIVMLSLAYSPNYKVDAKGEIAKIMAELPELPEISPEKKEEPVVAATAVSTNTKSVKGRRTRSVDQAFAQAPDTHSALTTEANEKAVEKAAEETKVAENVEVVKKEIQEKDLTKDIEIVKTEELKKEEEEKNKQETIIVKDDGSVDVVNTSDVVKEEKPEEKPIEGVADNREIIDLGTIEFDSTEVVASTTTSTGDTEVSGTSTTTVNTGVVACATTDTVNTEVVTCTTTDTVGGEATEGVATIATDNIIAAA